MAKLSGYRKLVKWIRIGDDFKKVSTETRAESVIMSTGETLEEKLGDFSWEDIKDKPTSFTPSSHNHDDRYYTKTELSCVTINLSKNNWGSSAPYTQTINVSGMTNDWLPGGFVIVPTDNVDTNKSMQKASGYISEIDTADGSVTVICYKKAPTSDLTIRISHDITEEV